MRFSKALPTLSESGLQEPKREAGPTSNKSSKVQYEIESIIQPAAEVNRNSIKIRQKHADNPRLRAADVLFLHAEYMKIVRNDRPKLRNLEI